jgi:hypothetical protein
MKYIFLFLFVVASVSAFATENCRPLYDAEPVKVSVAGRSGMSSLTANEMMLTGNALSPTQPAEKLDFRVGSFAFSLTPLSSCQDGLLFEFQNAQVKRRALVGWDREIVVDGKAGSESYVIVTVHKAKP